MGEGEGAKALAKVIGLITDEVTQLEPLGQVGAQREVGTLAKPNVIGASRSDTNFHKKIQDWSNE